MSNIGLLNYCCKKDLKLTREVTTLKTITITSDGINVHILVSFSKIVHLGQREKVVYKTLTSLSILQFKNHKIEK